jgi:hypothetical protein
MQPRMRVSAPFLKHRIIMPNENEGTDLLSFSQDHGKAP